MLRLLVKEVVEGLKGPLPLRLKASLLDRREPLKKRLCHLLGPYWWKGFVDARGPFNLSLGILKPHLSWQRMLPFFLGDWWQSSFDTFSASLSLNLAVHPGNRNPWWRIFDEGGSKWGFLFWGEFKEVKTGATTSYSDSRTPRRKGTNCPRSPTCLRTEGFAPSYVS